MKMPDDSGDGDVPGHLTRSPKYHINSHPAAQQILTKAHTPILCDEARSVNFPACPARATGCTAFTPAARRCMLEALDKTVI